MKRRCEKTYSIPGIFWEIIQVNPLRFVLQYVMSITSSVLLGLFVAQLQNVFNHAAVMVGTPSAVNMRTLLGSLLVLFLYKYGSEGLEILNGYIGNLYYNRCAAHFIYLYNQKFGKVSAITFEDEDKLNLYRNALEGAVAGRGMLHVIMDMFTMYIPYFVTISIYLAKQDPGLLAIFAFIAGPVLITNQMKKRIHTQLHNRAVGPQRRKEEYAKYLSDASYLKEVRVNRLFPYFYEKYRNARQEYNRFHISSNRKQLVLDLITKVITLAGFLAVIGLLMQRLTTGVIGIGAFGAIFYSLDDVYSLMDEALVSRIAEYHEKLPLLHAFINMMNSQSIEAEESTAEGALSTVSLQNVSFTYPNAQQAALQDISFTIHKNDKIAIVGYNGSGKSTLAKILLGLYQPTEGSLVMNGNPVNKLDRKIASVMFQNFNRYKETILNNVRISEQERRSDISQEKDRAEEMLKRVSLDLAEQGKPERILDVLCAREFGGTDLSGGQWQKLATARMLYRDRDFVILDEPTSQIDPVSEYQLFDLFEREIRDKTAIIITHTMASIGFCNRMIVLQDGKIQAMEDHETLMRTSPLYYQLYHSVETCYE